MVNYEYEDQKEDAAEIMSTLENSLATNSTRAHRITQTITRRLSPARKKIREIRDWAEAERLDELIEYCNFIAGAMEVASKEIVKLFRITEQSGGLFTNAQSLIEQYETQLETLAYEAEDLENAIQNGDIDHPRLQNFMRVARDEAEAEAKKVAYNATSLDHIMDITHHIRYLGLEGDETIAVRLASLVAGNAQNPTSEEIKAFKALVAAVNKREAQVNG